MNKSVLAALAIVIVLGAALYYGLTYQSRQATSTGLTTSTEYYTKAGPLEKKTDHVYTNEKYGFSLTMPDKWTNYTVQEFRIPDGSAVIRFGLPLETDQILQWTGTYEKENKNFEIWSVIVMKPAVWQAAQDACANPDPNDGPCFAPTEIKRNDTYVYASDQFFVAGGWDPCATEEEKKSEPYFCSVYKDMMVDGYTSSALKLL